MIMKNILKLATHMSAISVSKQTSKFNFVISHARNPWMESQIQNQDIEIFFEFSFIQWSLPSTVVLT